MGKNKNKQLQKKNNPIYKKVTSKSQTKFKTKTQPIKKSVQLQAKAAKNKLLVKKAKASAQPASGDTQGK
ncbi:hypothetical protein FHG87_008160 [Trinorchestia longiramus]|nr:hypothetical protein FHG87_008160 [Trinorchestia longiramus]